jgi:carbohydrate diacid regulator
MLDQFVRELLRGEMVDQAAARAQAETLKIDLARPQAIILVDASAHVIPSSDPPAEGGEQSCVHRVRKVIRAIGRFFSGSRNAVCAYLGDGVAVVLRPLRPLDCAPSEGAGSAASEDPSWAALTVLKREANDLLENLQQEVGSEISIGLGRCHPGPQGLCRSYRDARSALSLGARLHGAGLVHSSESLGIAALVGLPDEATKTEIAGRLLSPLDRQPELLETLTSFFAENCSPSPTATRIPIHRNTLAYRLNRVALLTGLDPRRFDEAVQLRLALVLRSLETGTGPLPLV